MENFLEPIPREFYSENTGKPFERCIHCNKKLHEPGVQWMVEKAHKNYPDYSAKDTIFDYAICMDCAMELRKELSEESRNNIDNFLQQHLLMHDRLDLAVTSEKFELDNYIGQCSISKKPLKDCREYQIQGLFEGDKMITGVFPIMISDDILEQLSELLSAKTRDELDDFRNTHFNIPPELKELFKDHTPILI